MRDYISSWFNELLLTSEHPGFGRLRVDVAQTSFFEGLVGRNANDRLR